MSAVQIREPRQREQEIAQAIEIGERALGRRRFFERGEAAFGPPGDGARHMETRARLGLSRIDEIAQRRQSVGRAIDLRFERLGLGVVECKIDLARFGADDGADRRRPRLGGLAAGTGAL